MKNLNKNFIRLFFISSVFSVGIGRAEIGCMDNSQHTKESFDSKVLYFCDCNCQCSKYKLSEDRGQCPKCGHYREPKKFEVIKVDKEKKYYERKTNEKTSGSTYFAYFQLPFTDCIENGTQNKK